MLLDVRMKRGADINSDHHLLVGEFRMKLAAKKKMDNKVQRRFEIRKLQNTNIRQELGITLRNRFQALEEGKNIDEKWTRCKNAITDTCEQVLGCWEARRKDWITDDTWEAIGARREAKMKLNKEADDTRKKLQREYQERNKIVKKKTKKDKKPYVEKLANEAEIAARQNNSRDLYKITRQLAGKNKSTSRPIRDKQGNLLTKESLQLQRWREYFQDILNRPPPDIEETTEDLNIN